MDVNVFVPFMIRQGGNALSRRFSNRADRNVGATLGRNAGFPKGRGSPKERVGCRQGHAGGA